MYKWATTILGPIWRATLILHKYVCGVIPVIALIEGITLNTCNFAQTSINKRYFILNVYNFNIQQKMYIYELYNVFRVHHRSGICKQWWSRRTMSKMEGQLLQTRAYVHLYHRGLFFYYLDSFDDFLLLPSQS